MTDRETDDQQPRHPQSGEPLETVKPSQSEKQARDRRNLAIGAALVVFAVLIFTVTFMRLSANVAGG